MGSLTLFRSIILVLAICTALADLQQNTEETPQLSINVNLRQKRDLEEDLQEVSNKYSLCKNLYSRTQNTIYPYVLHQYIYVSIYSSSCPFTHSLAS